MTYSLATIPRGKIPLPGIRTGIKLPSVPLATLPSLPGTADPATLPEIPGGRLRPQDLPAPRWHTFFGANGSLSASSAIPAEANFAGAANLTLTSLANLPADYSAAAALSYQGGGAPFTVFSGTGALDAVVNPNIPAGFNAEAHLGAVPVSLAKAEWLTVGQLGIGAYEVEVLFGVQFEGAGTTEVVSQPAGPLSPRAEGTATAVSQVKSTGPLTGSGTFIPNPQPLTAAMLTTESLLNLQVTQSAAANLNASADLNMTRDSYQINPYNYIVVPTGDATNTQHVEYLEVPMGARTVYVVAYGGGGGGAGGDSGFSRSGNGGYAGAYLEASVSVTGGTSLRLRAGRGGSGGSKDGDGSPGADSDFSIYEGTEWVEYIIASGGDRGAGRPVSGARSGESSQPFYGIAGGYGIDVPASGTAASGGSREVGKLYGGGGGGGAGGVFGGGSGGMRGGHGMVHIRIY